MQWMRSVLAILLGYAAMVAGTWIAQDALFPDVEYGAPLVPLLIMGLGTSAMGGAGGLVTAALAPKRPFLHLIPMAVLILVETVALYAQGRVHGPLWFELMAAASLIGGTIAGAAAWVVLRGRFHFRRLRAEGTGIRS